MQEWTDKELVEEMLKDVEVVEINGEMMQATSLENLKRIVFDPRFPDAKSETATKIVVAIQNHFNQLNTKK